MSSKWVSLPTASSFLSLTVLHSHVTHLFAVHASVADAAAHGERAARRWARALAARGGSGGSADDAIFDAYHQTPAVDGALLICFGPDVFVCKFSGSSSLHACYCGFSSDGMADIN